MKDDRLYLLHIREALARIRKYTKGGREEFLASELLQDATIRNLQTLTESTQRLSDEFKKEHPDVDWRAMAGFRNVMVHRYLSIDMTRVWQVVEKDLPDLRKKLQGAFRSLPSPPKTRRKKLPTKRTKRARKRKS